MKYCGFLLVLFFCVPLAFAETGTRVGLIQTLKGTATIQRDGQSVAAVPGGEIYRGDLIQTAKSSAMGVALADDTTISMGAESEFIVKECDFRPKEGKFALVLRMLKGTFSYISGVMTKLAPGAVRLETPDGTIAVRGTKLLIDLRQ